MDGKSPASPAVRARRRPAQRTEWRLAILGQTQHRHDGRQRPPLARRLGAGLAARRCRRPAQPALARPWRTWLLLSWAICTLASPTFAFVVVLLCIDARSDNPYFWWSLPSSSPPAMPSRSCAPTIVMAAVAMPTARAGAPARRHRPGHGRRPVPGGGRRLAAAGTGRHVAGHTGRRTGRPGGIALAMGFGWPRMCMPERCMPGWPFANRPPPCQRRPARADGGSTPPGHRRPARLVRGSTPPSGRRRACAQRTAAPPLAGAQARTARRTAHRNSRRAQASPGIARTRPASAMHRIARRTDRPRPARAASAAGKRGLAGLRIQVRITVGSVLAVPVAV